MMRRLKAGEFDEKAFSVKAQLIENYEIPTLAPEADPIAELFRPPLSPVLRQKGVFHCCLNYAQPAKTDPALQAKKPARLMQTAKS
jgi:hypothetical protein